MDEGVECVAIGPVDACEAEEVKGKIEGGGEVGPEVFIAETGMEWGSRWGELRD